MGRQTNGRKAIALANTPFSEFSLLDASYLGGALRFLILLFYEACFFRHGPNTFGLGRGIERRCGIQNAPAFKMSDERSHNNRKRELTTEHYAVRKAVQYVFDPWPVQRRLFHDREQNWEASAHQPWSHR